MEVRSKINFLQGVLCILCLAVIMGAAKDTSKLKDLKDKLLKDYSVHTRPVQIHTTATVVTMALIPFHITVDEARNLLVMNGMLLMDWKDENLVWNAVDYGNITSFVVPAHQVWKPDIRLMNSYKPYDEEKVTNRLIVYHDGMISWMAVTEWVSPCEFDFTYWPYDKQSCQLYFLSWSHEGWDIDLEVSYDGQVILFAYKGQTWKALESFGERIERNFSMEEVKFVYIKYKINMERISYYDRKLVVIPSLVICALTLATLWLPPDDIRKVVIGSVDMLIMTLMLTFFRKLLPVTGTAMPLVVIFHGSTLILVGTTLLFSLVVIKVMHIQEEPPARILTLLEGRLGWLLCLGEIQKESTDREMIVTAATGDMADEVENQPNKENAKKEDKEKEKWLIVAKALDRIAFFIFIVIIIILMAKFLS